jgi:protein phosphatase
VIPTDNPHLGVVAFSHPGETGKNNEDRFSVTSYRMESDDRPCVLAVVADGIGGHQAGEVAAEIAINTLHNTLAPSSGVQPVRELRAAVLEAARAVSRASQESPEREGMGSTLAVVWVVGPKLYIASVGDSRIYLLRRARLYQLTTDHTWIQEALDHKVITPEEAREHPNVHVLRRHLGGRQEPEPDMRLRLPGDRNDGQSEAHQGLRLEPGDQLLLCSDGLTDLVQHAELQASLAERSPMESSQSLIDLARSRGGFDNITVILLTVPGVPRRRLRAASLARPRLAAWALATLTASLALVCLALLATGAAWWFGVGAWGRVTPGPVASPPPAASPQPTEAGESPAATQTPFAPPTAAVLLTPTPSSTPYPLPTITPTP